MNFWKPAATCPSDADRGPDPVAPTATTVLRTATLEKAEHRVLFGSDDRHRPTTWQPDTSAGRSGVPAFWAEASPQRRVPFVVSLYLVDGDGKCRLPPAVEHAIDSIVDATGRHGLAIASVLDMPNANEAARRALERAMVMSGVIVLFRCQSVESSERLMDFLYSTYDLSLVRGS